MGKAVRAVVQIGFTTVGQAVGFLAGGYVGAVVGAAIGAEIGGLVANATIPVRSPKPPTTETALKSPRPARISGYAITRARGAYIAADIA